MYWGSSQLPTAGQLEGATAVSSGSQVGVFQGASLQTQDKNFLNLCEVMLSDFECAKLPHPQITSRNAYKLSILTYFILQAEGMNIQAGNCLGDISPDN